MELLGQVLRNGLLGMWQIAENPSFREADLSGLGQAHSNVNGELLDNGRTAQRLWLNQKRSSPKRLNNLSKKREDLRNKSNGMKTFVSGQLARVESC